MIGSLFKLELDSFEDTKVRLIIKLAINCSSVSLVRTKIFKDKQQLQVDKQDSPKQSELFVTFTHLLPGCFYEVVAEVLTRTGEKDSKTCFVFTSTNGEPSKLSVVEARPFDKSQPDKGRVEERKWEERLKRGASQHISSKHAEGLSASEKEFGRVFTGDPYLLKLAGGKTQLRKALIDGRKATGLKDYLNHNFKFCKPAKLQQERLQRTLVYGNAVAALRNRHIHNEQLNDHNQFFGNNWGMGPFYSYNANYEEINTKKAKIVNPEINN